MSRKASASPISDEPSVKTPRDRWVELFGSDPLHKRQDFIEQALAWQEQMLAHGDVSPAVQRDLNVAAGRAVVSPLASVAAAAQAPQTTAPRTGTGGRVSSANKRGPLPPVSSQLVPGTRLVKAYGGVNHVVQVTIEGMVYNGVTYRSLSAIAKVITGTHWNGLLFFGLRVRKVYPRSKASA